MSATNNGLYLSKIFDNFWTICYNYNVVILMYYCTTIIHYYIITERRKLDSQTKIIQFRVSKEEYQQWKDIALSLRYMNFSQFLRDMIRDSVKKYQ